MLSSESNLSGNDSECNQDKYALLIEIYRITDMISLAHAFLDEVDLMMNVVKNTKDTRGQIVSITGEFNAQQCTQSCDKIKTTKKMTICFTQTTF